MGFSGGGRSHATGGRRRLAAVLAPLCLLALLQAPASADKGPWPDQNDARGPLAIRKIEIGHIRSWGRASTLTVIFDRPVDPARLGRRDFFVLDISGNARANSDVWFYFWGGGRQWFTYSYDPREKSVGYGGFWIRRLSPNSFKIILPYVDSRFRRETGGYRFRLASFSRTGTGCAEGCFDLVPNGDWLIHDWTRPTVERWEVSEYSMAPGDQAGVPVTFRVADRGFSGLAGWVLSKRIAGTQEWSRVRRGRSTALVRALVPTEQGQKVQLRLEATDGARNTAKPVFANTVVPYDDSNETAGATYVGFWEEQEYPGAYLDRLRVSSSPVDTFRFTAVARRYCVSYRVIAEHGAGRLEVGGQSTYLDMSFSYTPPHGIGCVELESEEARTAVVDISEGTVNVDGFWFE